MCKIRKANHKNNMEDIGIGNGIMYAPNKNLFKTHHKLQSESLEVTENKLNNHQNIKQVYNGVNNVNYCFNVDNDVEVIGDEQQTASQHHNEQEGS